MKILETLKLTKFVLLSFCLTILNLWISSSVYAYTCNEFGCTTWCETPTYYISDLCADLESYESGTTVSTVQTAMTDWTLLSCAQMNINYGGRQSLDPTSGDGISVISWYQEDWPYDINIIGLTITDTSGGCIIEADIAMNAESFEWTVQPGSPGIINAYSAILHEGGHFYGLGHSSDSEAAMYYSYGRNINYIDEDDEDGFCALYPSDDSTSDCASTGCPSGYECEESACVKSEAPPCMSDTDCAADKQCNLDNGVCVPRDEGEGLGIACSSNEECETNLCAETALGSICTETCDALNPYSCPDEYYCSGKSINDCITGICLPGDSGAGAFGSACSEDTDCSSLHCAGEICSYPCEPSDEVSTCPSGYVCLSDIAGSCGACGEPKTIGSRCESSSECESELCYAENDDSHGVCTQECTISTACPSGFECTAEDGGDGVCIARNQNGCSCSMWHSKEHSSLFIVLLAPLFLSMIRLLKNRGSI